MDNHIRNDHLHIRFTATELEAVRRAAGRRTRPISDFARIVLLREAEASDRRADAKAAKAQRGGRP